MSLPASSFLLQLTDDASLRIAVAGDGSGNLEVSGRANWIYARLGSSAGPVIEVHSGAIRPNYDDAFYVGKEHPTRGGGWRTVFWLRDGADATLPAPVVGSTYVRDFLADSDGVILTDSDGEFME